MKCLSFLNFAWVLFATLVSPALWAGNEISGGGDVLILPDDRVILADPFVVRPGSPAELHPALREEILRVGVVLAHFGSQDDFAKDNILNPYIDYRYANAPLDCKRIETGSLPAGSYKQVAACTEGPLTLLDETLFKKMSVREQAKLILHERLRAIKVSAPGSFIADVTDGVEIGLELLNAQLNGKSLVLSQAQIAKLQILIRRIVQLEMGKNFMGPRASMLVIHPNGGGIAISSALIHPTAALGIGTLLMDPETQVEEGAVVNGVYCWDKCQIKARARVVMSKVRVESIVLGEGSLIEGTPIRATSVELGSGAQVVKTEIKLHPLLTMKIVVGPNSLVQDSAVAEVGVLSLGEGCSLVRSKLEAFSPPSYAGHMARFEIAGNSSVVDSVVKALDMRLLDQAEIKKSKLSLANITLNTRSLVENSTVAPKVGDTYPALTLALGARLTRSEIGFIAFKNIGHCDYCNTQVVLGNNAEVDQSAFDFKWVRDVEFEKLSGTIGVVATVHNTHGGVFSQKRRFAIQGGYTIRGAGQDVCGTGREVRISGNFEAASLADLQSRCEAIQK